MSLSFPRLAAAVSLGIGGALTALTAFGLIVADVVIRSDRFDVTPADATALARMTLGAPVVGRSAPRPSSPRSRSWQVPVDRARSASRSLASGSPSASG